MINKKRYYIQKPLEQDSTIILEEGEHQHLKNVMRSRIGEEVELINGNGFLGEGRICAIERHYSKIDLEKVTFFPRSSYEMTLVQALIKLPKLEWILEKSTELGVSSIVLWSAQRSEQKLPTPTQIERMKAIIVSSLKQSKRVWEPTFNVIHDLKELKQNLILFGSLGDDAVMLNQLKQPESTKASFVIGPEGGFIEDEEEYLRSLGAYAVTLSDGVLRAETAACVALSSLYQFLKSS